MTAHIDLVNHFLTLWWAGKIHEAAQLVTDDFLWENMPWPDRQQHGRDTFVASSLSWREICSQGEHRNTTEVESGPLVILERIEHYTVQGNPMEMKVAGFFTIREGRIAGWRDYYDQATYQRQMADSGLLETSNSQLTSVGLC